MLKQKSKLLLKIYDIKVSQLVQFFSNTNKLAENDITVISPAKIFPSAKQRNKVVFI